VNEYRVYLERAAERDLKRLSSEEFDRIISNIRALAENPRPAGCRKIVGSKNDWRIRVGEYRIIYEVDDEKKAVMVMRVRHRREAYR
jgi:mRNA interferase RelE/StbE